MSDKLQRVFNLLDADAEVEDEKIEDTLSDLRNYANILQVWLDKHSGKEEGKEPVSRRCPVCGREFEKPVEECVCGTEKDLTTIYPM